MTNLKAIFSEHSHQVCQMPNIWHLAHQTSKVDPHEMCQMPKNLTHRYSTVSNMKRYGHQCYNFFSYFIHFSLSSLVSVALFSFSLSFFLSHSLPLSVCNSHHHHTLQLSYKDRDPTRFIPTRPRSGENFGLLSLIRRSLSLSLSLSLHTSPNSFFLSLFWWLWQYF